MKLNETVALLLGDNHPVITESVAVFEDNSCESEPLTTYLQSQH